MTGWCLGKGLPLPFHRNKTNYLKTVGLPWVTFTTARCCHRGVEYLEATNQLKIGKLVSYRGWYQLFYVGMPVSPQSGCWPAPYHQDDMKHFLAHRDPGMNLHLPLLVGEGASQLICVSQNEWVKIVNIHWSMILEKVNLHTPVILNIERQEHLIISLFSFESSG